MHYSWGELSLANWPSLCAFSVPQTLSPNLGKGLPPAVAPRPKAQPRLGPSNSIKEKQGPLRDLFGPNPPTAQEPPPPPAPPLPSFEEPRTPLAEPRGKEPHPHGQWASLGPTASGDPVAEVISAQLRSAAWAFGLWSQGAPASAFPCRAEPGNPGPVWHEGPSNTGCRPGCSPDSSVGNSVDMTEVGRDTRKGRARNGGRRRC